MNIELLILIILTKSIFFGVGIVDCRVDSKEYKSYFIQVTHNLRFQLTMMNLEHLSVKVENDKIISIEEVLNYNLVYLNELSQTYYIIVDLINYLFVEVLQIFTEHLKIILDDCKCFFEINSFENAIYCTVILLNAAKNSNMMFEYLYKSITFIDYLDVKSALKKTFIHPKLVVEEIYTVKHYTFLMEVSDMHNYVNNEGSIKIEEAKEDYYKIMNFANKVVSITHDFFKNNVSIINNTMMFNLRENYYYEYTNNKYDINFIDFINKNLNDYCKKTINNYYSKIGFHQLLNPNTPELSPPQNIGFPQYKIIKNLNILFREGNWNLLNHIRIIIDDELITTNRIIRDTVDDFNFNLKKKYFTQLLRCRYTEVLRNYNTYMSAVIQTCKREKRNANLNNYKDCII
ncbi:uncharacterized protein LOC126910479 [Daktulosphaira vitifoliae]|uniref:uncharacterized protein LOC126910479 n=1 Tax=Daktulosphaira vitifoliae TaxID=58002 RepID=UPI0021AA31B7|nr:uncharacterized protein LOC126910479 [Daktulosphaira vitifoliae]